MVVAGQDRSGWLVDDLEAVERRLRREFGAPGPHRGLRLWAQWVEENRRLEELSNRSDTGVEDVANGSTPENPAWAPDAEFSVYRRLEPRFDHRGRLGRWLASWTAKVLGAWFKPWLVPQRRVNREVARALENLSTALDRLKSEVQRLDAKWCGSESTRADLIRQQHLVQLGLALAWQTAGLVPGAANRGRRRPVEDRPLQEPASNHPLGLGIQESFRGPRELVARRLSEHVPRVKRAVAALGGGVVLDLGCGRGEWLELLRDEGLTAVGVDLAEEATARCGSLGLAVARGDALGYLASRDDDAFTVVTAFHVVEHLTFDVLGDLLREIHRVLEPGGLVLLETPNPECLPAINVGYRCDPTHRRPLPSPLLTKLVESVGFQSAGVELLTTARGIVPIDLDAPGGVDEEEWGRLLKVVNQNLLSAPDYAVYAYKPGMA